MTDEQRMEKIISEMERGNRSSGRVGLDLNSKEFKVHKGLNTPEGIIDVTRDDITYG